MNETTAPPDIVRSEAVVKDSPAPQATSLLETSRRVDWRFLLPDPNLGTVAVAGKASKALREALPLFSRQVSFMEAPYSAADQVDLVVICGSLETPLSAALELVKPGGCVYVELRGRLRLKGVRPTHSLAINKKLLRARGFEDIQAFWHSPNFEGCKRIIPLDNPAALVYALKKTDSPLMQRLIRESVFFSHRSGLLRLVMSSLSLVARRGAA